MSVLDIMTNSFEELFFKKHSSHYVCNHEREKELRESHKNMRKDIQSMIATLNGESDWFLRVVRPEKNSTSSHSGG